MPGRASATSGLGFRGLQFKGLGCQLGLRVNASGFRAFIQKIPPSTVDQGKHKQSKHRNSKPLNPKPLNPKLSQGDATSLGAPGTAASARAGAGDLYLKIVGLCIPYLKGQGT